MNDFEEYIRQGEPQKREKRLCLANRYRLAGGG